MRIAIIGTGYVGLVTSVVLAELGNNVICVDKDPTKLELLRRGVPPIYEPGVDELLKRGIKAGFLDFTDSIGFAAERSEVIFIAVGTPPAADGAPDLSAVVAVATEIGKHINDYKVIVNKSTVPIGTGDMVEKIILDQGVPADQFDVVSNPEFLREGSAIQDTLKPDRIVIGSKSGKAADKLVELYEPLQAPFITTDLFSAELIKYGANAFLAMKISFINAISAVCEICGADVTAVSKGIGSDDRIGPKFLQAGLGWGGSCFPKDVQGMIKTAEKLGYDFKLLNEVVNINDDQVTRFIARIDERLGGVKGKRIGLMGLAFKPNTDDIRDSKAVIILEYLKANGAHVLAYDPVAIENVRKLHPEIEYVDGVYDVADAADALILATDWNEFRQLDLDRLGACMKQRLMFDGRRIYSPEHAHKSGWELHTIGTKS